MTITLKELKKNRPTPAEKWVLETIDGVEPKTLSNGNVDWYDKDGEWLFEQDFKNGWVYVCYQYIWSVLRGEFGLNDGEIQELLSNLLYDYTNNGKSKINQPWESL